MPVATMADVLLGDLVDEHRRITQHARTHGRRHDEDRAHAITAELDQRAADGNADALEAARLLRLERALVIAPDDNIDQATASRDVFAARVTARARAQRDLDALRVRLDRTVADLAAAHRDLTRSVRRDGLRPTAERANLLITQIRGRGHHLLANALDDERALTGTPIDHAADITGADRAYRAAQLRRVQGTVRRLTAALGGA